MRNSIHNLISNTIKLEFTLPYGEIDKSSITTENDYCLKGKDDKIVELIYNSIIDYCFNESEIDLTNLNNNQIYALQNRMRFNENDTHKAQIKYGFYGETLLNILLEYLFNTKKIIAKGYFYSPIENSESKGYDNFHFLVDENDDIELWFGEAKMYGSLKKAIKKVIDNINNALSIQYLDRNFRAILSRINDLDDSEITQKIKDFNLKLKNGNINVWEELKNNNFTITYPIFISYENNCSDYEKIIKDSLTEIEKRIDTIVLNNQISAKILFILLPVNEMIKIKEGVLECIYQKKSVQ